jgi:hypothetical protein
VLQEIITEVITFPVQLMPIQIEQLIPDRVQVVRIELQIIPGLLQDPIIVELAQPVVRPIQGQLKLALVQGVKLINLLEHITDRLI